jgi:carbon storage regulator CsrA
MLVLSRRLHEKIVLPALNVTIQVAAVQGKVVRLGIQAPPQIRVVRQELLGRPALATGR